MSYPLDLLMIPIQLIVAWFTIYYTVIALFGMWHKKEKKIAEPKSKFALMVPAHNEEMVLGDLLDNLNLLKYPKELYDVYVIADNCTDKTADVAKKHGAYVLERFNKEHAGKGYAMDWAFPKIFETGKKYDAFCVFDADNLVHLDFLSVMNTRLLKGQKVLQGYLSAKNPVDTWVSGTFAIAFWTVNHLWHLGKYNIGLSSCLGGTGMCISSDIVKEFGWGCDCLTEDMEFSMKCLSRGIRTCWVHDAIIYDEKPLSFMASWRQRKRWAQGQFDCLGTIQYILPLVVLLQIEVPIKIYLYWLIYPIFMYSWVPVTFLGWLHRHDKEWVHTVHTRSMQFEDASLTRKKEIE